MIFWKYESIYKEKFYSISSVYVYLFKDLAALAVYNNASSARHRKKKKKDLMFSDFTQTTPLASYLTLPLFRF